MRQLGPLLLGLAFSSVALAADTPEKPILVLDAGGHTATVWKVLFTRDGKQLISVSQDKTIRVWDVASGAPLRVLRPPIGPIAGGQFYAAALTPDGRTLAAGGTGWRLGEVPIYLIDLATGSILRVLKGIRIASLLSPSLRPVSDLHQGVMTAPRGSGARSAGGASGCSKGTRTWYAMLPSLRMAAASPPHLSTKPAGSGH